MNKIYEETFFKASQQDNPTTEVIKADTIKNLKETIRLSRESREIADKTTYEIYKQDASLVEGKKDLIRMNKPLKKADESLSHMADGCGGSCAIF